MDSLSVELVIAIAERMDIESMLKLKLVNQRFAKIISNYERSISMTRTAAFFIPPSSDVLSSDLFRRRALGFRTFEMVRELEKRDDRINKIFKHAGFIDIICPPGLGIINAAQQRRVLDLFRRSIWLCDQIADMAGNIPEARMQERAYDPLRSRFYEESNEILGYRLMNPINNPRARPYQYMYIQSLPLEDVAMMYYLVNTLSTNFLDELTDWFDSDPAILERATVFEESVLRHGSWFLWAHFSKDHMWNRLADKISSLGLVEMTAYENGVEGYERGLKQGLMSRFRELVGSKKHTLTKMHIIVRRMVLGTNEKWKDEDDEDDEDEDEYIWT